MTLPNDIGLHLQTLTITTPEGQYATAVRLRQLREEALYCADITRDAPVHRAAFDGLERAITVLLREAF